MTGAPRNACSEVYDYIWRWNKERFIELIKEMNESVTKTTRVSFIGDELMFSPTYDWLTMASTQIATKIK
jgi:hypothetical protein